MSTHACEEFKERVKEAIDFPALVTRTVTLPRVRFTTTATPAWPSTPIMPIASPVASIGMPSAGSCSGTALTSAPPWIF
jgi:hypothetical protein